MNVAIIPARGGSRRIQRKNIRSFHGKPILAYSIEAAKESGLFDAVYVSSDDTEILSMARRYGATAIERELRYAQDDIGTQEVIRDALVELELLGVEPEYVCCIYATVPMLRADDLTNGYNVMRVIDDYAYVPGWFYWGRAEWFGLRPLKEPPPLVVASARYIDINTEDDWNLAEEMYAALYKEAA